MKAVQSSSAALLLIIAGGIGFIGWRLEQTSARVDQLARDVHPVSPLTGLNNFTYQCVTNAEQATCMLTNPGKTIAAVACIRGVVRRKDGTSGVPAVSIVGCTGEVKPMETRTLQAMFPLHEIERVCPGKGGFQTVDWSGCEFEVKDVTGNPSQ